MDLALLVATTSLLVLALTLGGATLLGWLRGSAADAPSPFEGLALGILATFVLGSIGLRLQIVIWLMLALAAYATLCWIRGRAPCDARGYSVGALIALPLALLALMLKVLAEPTIGADARTIWMFAAKIMFYHGGLYDLPALTDPVFAGFASYHFDYPKLLPWLSALVAGFHGTWNEYVPRLSLPLFAAAAGFAIAELQVLGPVGKLFLAGALLTQSPRFLVNGNADLWLAIFGALAVLFVCQFLASPGAGALTPAGLALSLALNLKNEGEPLVLLILLAGGLGYRVLCWRQVEVSRPAASQWAIAGLLIVVPALPWKVVQALWGIHSEFFSGRSLTQLIALINRDRLALIYDRFWRLPGNDTLLALSIVLLVLVALWMRSRSRSDVPARERLRWLALAALPVLVAILYLVAVSCIYLVTPAPLAWHLTFSVVRVSMTPRLLFVAGWLLAAEALRAQPAGRR
jgi:hypothetical protein